MIRDAAVSGLFYPSDSEELKKLIEKFGAIKDRRVKALGVVAPHAGYLYSGQCAADVYRQIVIPETVIILGVDHRGETDGLTIDGHSHWSSPFGNVEVDIEMRDLILNRNPLFKLSSDFGLEEHSLEVHLPFIQYYGENPRIIPIMVSTHNMETLKSCGSTLGEIAKSSGTLVVASTDMSHFISSKDAVISDGFAIEAIKNCDPESLMEVVYRNRISMCGVAPVALLLNLISEVFGKQQGRTVSYTNSGEVTGDFSNVVAYFSGIFEQPGRGA